jgi:hypothetical protein
MLSSGGRRTDEVCRLWFAMQSDSREVVVAVYLWEDCGTLK